LIAPGTKLITKTIDTYLQILCTNKMEVSSRPSCLRRSRSSGRFEYATTIPLLHYRAL
jgi:hypothetical protein